MMKGSIRGCLFFDIGGALLFLLSCSDLKLPDSPEQVGVASSPITAATSNFPVAGYTSSNELNLTYVQGVGPQSCGTQPGCSVGSWSVVGNQPGCTSVWTWAYSTDGNGNSWNFQTQTSATQFGSPPGNGPGGNPFVGLAWDHSVAAVTDSSWGAGNPPTTPPAWEKTVVGVSTMPNIAGGKCDYGDGVVFLSTDGGQSWGNGTMQWLDTTNSYRVDLPFVFSNPLSPYHTFAAWESLQLQTPPQGFLRQISYNLNSTPPAPQFDQLFGGPLAIPKTALDSATTGCGASGQGACMPARFNFGLTKLPNPPCASGQEGIIVVWATIPSGASVRCNNSSAFDSADPGENQGQINWNLAIFDTGPNGGTGPGWISKTGPSGCLQGNCTGCANGNCAVSFASSPVFNRCVGNTYSPTCTTSGCPCNGANPCPWETNSEDPHIAVDPNPPAGADVFWISHTYQLAGQAVQTAIESAKWACVPNNTLPLYWEPPQKFSPPSAGDDQFLPAVAMHEGSSGNQRVGVYWYGTSDGSQPNSLVNVFAGFKDTSNNPPWSGPTQLTSVNYPLVPAGETNWPITANTQAPEFDYQTMGTSWTNHSFLSVWPRDLRQGLLAPAWNGGFETGDLTGWTLSGQSTPQISSVFNSGAYSAYLSANNTGSVCCGAPCGNESTISQTFTVPNVGQNLSVSFYYKMVCAGGACPDSGLTSCDWVTATITPQGGSPQSWLPKTYSLNAWLHSPQYTGLVPGNTYTMTITNHDDNYQTNGGDDTSTYIDDVVFSGPSNQMTIVANLAQ